jgi:hypothetical protein
MLSSSNILQFNLLVNKGLQSLLEVLNSHLLTLPVDLLATSSVLGWHENVRDNLDDTIAGDTVMDSYAREAVDPDGHKRSVPRYIDGKVLATQHSLQVVMVVRWAGSDVLFVILLSVIERVRVQSLVNDHVVLQQRTEVLLAILAKQEGVHPGAKLLEGEVARGEECSAIVVVLGAVQLVEETGLAKTKLESAELAGQEVDDRSDVGWRDEDGVDAMDDAVCAEDVDSDQPAVEVDGRALKSDADSQALLVSEVVLGLVKSGDSVAVEHTAGWVEVVRDVVLKNALQDLLRWLLAVLGDLLKGLVSRSKHGVVCLGAIEELH